jgi:hypothetical protein
MNGLLQCAMAYLASEKRTSNAVSAMLEGGGRDDSATVCLPVMYLAAKESTPAPAEKIVTPPAPGPLTNDPEMKRKILAQFRERNLSWRPLSGESKDQIERFLFPLIDAIHTPSQDQDAQVRKMILQLWKNHTPEALPF